MTGASPVSPVLFCFDGSDGSREAMRAAADLIARPVDAVVLTVWETVATRLALAGAFAAGSTTGGADLDAEEESYARSVAEEGALRAGEHGYNASDGPGVLRRDSQGHPGDRGQPLSTLDRVRPTGSGPRYGAPCSAAFRTPWRLTPAARSSLLQNTLLGTIEGR